MKRIYVAGPFTAETDAAIYANVAAAIRDGQAIDALGGNAFVPHLWYWWDKFHAGDYERWMKKCLAELERCDALYRRPGSSPGASREVIRATELRIPVFHTFDTLKGWMRFASPVARVAP
jgi:hypothetical protein